MYSSGIHERLQSIVGQRSSRHIGDLTGTNHETVRRYLTGHVPSVEFLQALCKVFGVSGEWLLTGKGPVRAVEIRGEALRDAGAGELLTALSAAVERLIERVDRLELLMQTMEVRIRGGGEGGGPGGTGLRATSFQEVRDAQAKKGSVGEGVEAGGAQARVEPKPGEGGDRAIPERVLRLRDTFAVRPRADVG
jgi:transcriptional regulator with XRE-family HTH domain